MMCGMVDTLFGYDSLWANDKEIQTQHLSLRLKTLRWVTTVYMVNQTQLDPQVPAFEASCFCGATSYRVEGRPIFSLYCHCTICQRMHGMYTYELGKASINNICTQQVPLCTSCTTTRSA